VKVRLQRAGAILKITGRFLPALQRWNEEQRGFLLKSVRLSKNFSPKCWEHTSYLRALCESAFGAIGSHFENNGKMFAAAATLK